MSKPDKPVSFPEYILFSGIVLTAGLVYNLVAMMAGAEVVADPGPAPTTMDGTQWRIYGHRLTDAGQDALFFFMTLLGPPLVLVGYLLQPKSHARRSRLPVRLQPSEAQDENDRRLAVDVNDARNFLRDLEQRDMQ